MSNFDVKLKEIFIGNADGGTESTKENFENLFYKTRKYDDIKRNPNKFIISGQKGTGKTILAKYIEKTCTTSKSTAKLITVEDFKLYKLKECEDQKLDKFESAYFFRWVILMEFSKILMSSNSFEIKNDSFYSKAWSLITYKLKIKKLKKLINERYPKGNYLCKEYFKETGKKCSVNKLIDVYKVCGELSEKDNRKYTKKKYYEILDEIENLVLELLKNNKIMLMFDNLDDIGLNFYEDDIGIKLFLKLLDELKNFNTRLIENQLVGNKCVIIIRSDILSKINLYSSNSNKIIADSEVNLYWIDKQCKGNNRHMLMEMIVNKIKNSNDNLKDIDTNTIYSKLFADTVNNKTIIDYLLDYSFGRPRDVIKYLSIIQEKNGEENKFYGKLFKDCATEYSKWFLEELKNELNIHKEPMYVNDILKLLNDFSHRTFYYKELEEYFEKRKNQYPRIEDLEECLKTLYEIGAVGNSWKCEGRGVKFSWGYRADGNPSVDFTKKFSIHYGLRKIFSL